MHLKLTINSAPGEIDLDEKCWNCNEDGVVNQRGIGDPGSICDICKGIGYQLTKAGENVIALLARHRQK